MLLIEEDDCQFPPEHPGRVIAKHVEREVARAVPRVKAPLQNRAAAAWPVLKSKAAPRPADPLMWASRSSQSARAGLGGADQSEVAPVPEVHTPEEDQRATLMTSDEHIRFANRVTKSLRHDRVHIP